MWLDLDIGSLLQVHVSQNDLRALLNAKIVHHPDRYMAHAFLSRELQHAAVRLDSHLRVRDHEGHGVLDAQPRQFMQGTRWQNYYITTKSVSFFFSLMEQGRFCR